MKSDYILVGSGLAALSFGALMAKSGKRVKVIEPHYLPGGYGHTFEFDNYKFNAQLHYVWNCGEGQTVNKILKKLGLDQQVTFSEYDSNGFDRMRAPGYSLNIPYDYELLAQRLGEQFPKEKHDIARFVLAVRDMSDAIDQMSQIALKAFSDATAFRSTLKHFSNIPTLLKFRRATLQQVFEHYKLPSAAQTLLGLQWPDFMLPPNQLSFIAWMLLFTGYCRGAYYPDHHFEHVCNALVDVIEPAGGEVIYEHKVVDFLRRGKAVEGVTIDSVINLGALSNHYAHDVICNMDPRQAAEMIGFSHFSPKLRKQLDYDYSYSNYMVYAVVKGIDLRDYGFGKSNLFHTEEMDLNKAFYNMHTLGDYSAPSFAVTVPSLLSEDRSDCPPDHQIIEFLTVANYQRFLDLKLSSPRAYRKKKKEIFDAMLDIMERDYVPELRKHLVFDITGSPTSNERYCWSPAGNSYGSNMTPENIGMGRLKHKTSLKNFYFCNASSGYAGFAGTIWTGCNLYERLSGDRFLNT